MRTGTSGPVVAAVFIVGWTLMTVAMMLPSSSLLILLFHRMVADKPNAAWLVTLLVTGYLAVWTLFGLAVHLMNRVLQRAALRIPWLAEHAWVFTAAILIVAGLFQFSRLKYACLDKCRTPMGFLMERWRGGRASMEAFRLGADHGIFCVGCCWALMLVMFSVSVGSLAWMLSLGAVMAAEKNLPWGRRLSAPIGVVLVVAGVALVMLRV